MKNSANTNSGIELLYTYFFDRGLNYAVLTQAQFEYWQELCRGLTLDEIVRHNYAICSNTKDKTVWIKRLE